MVNEKPVETWVPICPQENIPRSMIVAPAICNPFEQRGQHVYAKLEVYCPECQVRVNIINLTFRRI